MQVSPLLHVAGVCGCHNSRSFERPERTASTTSAARSGRTKDTPRRFWRKAPPVNGHDRVNGTHSHGSAAAPVACQVPPLHMRHP